MEIFTTNSLAGGFSQFANSVRSYTDSLYTHVKANSYDKMTQQQRIIGIALAIVAAFSACYIIYRVWQFKGSPLETSPIPEIGISKQEPPVKAAPPSPAVEPILKNEQKPTTPQQQTSAVAIEATPSHTPPVSSPASTIVTTLPAVDPKPQTPGEPNTPSTQSTPPNQKTAPETTQSIAQSPLPTSTSSIAPSAGTPVAQPQAHIATPLKHPLIKKLQDEDKANLLKSPMNSPKPTAFINSVNSPFDTAKEVPPIDLSAKTPQLSEASKEQTITTPGGHPVNPADVKDGEHHLHFEDGYELYGTFKNGLLTGPGRLVDPILCRELTGNFDNGRLNGEGFVLFFSSRDFKQETCIRKEEGQFVEDMLHGKGSVEKPNRIYLSSGAIQEGEFKCGRLNGKGTITYPNGNYKKGMFFEGKLHGKGEQKIGKEEKKGDFIYGKFQEKKKNFFGF